MEFVAGNDQDVLCVSFVLIGVDACSRVEDDSLFK